MSLATPIAIDFETFHSKKLKYGLRTMIAEEYCKHELFDCYLVSVCDGANSWSGHPSQCNWAALDGHPLLSHNRYFDNTVYNALRKRGLVPEIRFPSWHCTANLTSFLCNRRALKDAVEKLFGSYVSKDYREIAEGKHWPQYTDAEREQLKESGRGDALWCWKIWDRFSNQWPEMERELSTLTIDQGMRGVQIDTGLLDEYIMRTHEMLMETQKVIPWIADSEDETWDEFNTKPTSTKCIAEQCRRMNIPCPPVKTYDEEGYEEWELRHGPEHPWINAVGSWRSINKLLQTFTTMKRRIRPDGTMPFGLKYFGAHTGRWAGDAKINFQNMRKTPLLGDQSRRMATNDVQIADAVKQHKKTGKWPDWVSCAIDFRALVIPRPRTKMIASDLSQIEPRVLAWLCGNTQMLEKIRGGMSVYEAFARTTMGYEGPKMDKSTDFYKRIKIQVLQLGYQAGWAKFIVTALKEGGLDLTADDPEWIEDEDPFTGEIKRVPGYGSTAKNIVAKFREQNPKITGLWQLLDNKFRAAIGEDFVMTLPSGRKMRYEKIAASVRIIKDPVTGKPRRQTEFTADVGGKRSAYYGGKLTENITQAVARDVFGWQLVNMNRLGWPILFTSHDEAILELPDSVTAADVEREMSRCPEWLPGCPIAAEAKELQHYTK